MKHILQAAMLGMAVWVSNLVGPTGEVHQERWNSRWECVVNSDVFLRINPTFVTDYNNCGNPICRNMSLPVEDRRNMPSDKDKECAPTAHDGSGN